MVKNSQKDIIAAVLNGATQEDIERSFRLMPKIAASYIKRYAGKKKSNLEKDLGEILRTIYDGYAVQEQVNIDGLFLDYYIPKLRLAFEADGVQHSKPVGFFHGKGELTKAMNFEHGVNNDAKKNKDCSTRYIYVIRIKHTEKITYENIKRIIDESGNEIIQNLNAYSEFYEPDIENGKRF